MTARTSCDCIVRVALICLFAAAVCLFWVAPAGAIELFHETFDGYSSFPVENPAGDPVNPGLPEISEGADELWYGGRFMTPDNGTIQQDLAVQKIGGSPNNTHVGRAEDEAALMFNVSTLGLFSVDLDFDWRLFSGGGLDMLRVGYYVGTITGWAGDRTQDFQAPDPYQWSVWTELDATSSNSWASVNYSLPAGQSSVWVAFWLDNGEGDFGKIDNVVVSGQLVPEPSTFVLAGFGIIGVGCVAIRRRRARRGLNVAAELRADSTVDCAIDTAALRADCAGDLAELRANRA